MLTKAITAENSEKAAVTDKNIIVVNHSPGSITSSATFSAFCRCTGWTVNLKTQKLVTYFVIQVFVMFTIVVSLCVILGDFKFEIARNCGTC